MSCVFKLIDALPATRDPTQPHWSPVTRWIFCLTADRLVHSSIVRCTRRHSRVTQGHVLCTSCPKQSGRQLGNPHWPLCHQEDHATTYTHLPYVYLSEARPLLFALICSFPVLPERFRECVHFREFFGLPSALIVTRAFVSINIAEGDELLRMCG